MKTVQKQIIKIDCKSCKKMFFELLPLCFILCNLSRSPLLVTSNMGHFNVKDQEYMDHTKWKGVFKHAQNALYSSSTCSKSHLGICSPFEHSIVSNNYVSKNVGPDQTAKICSLIWAFTGHKCLKTCFRIPQLHDVNTFCDLVELQENTYNLNLIGVCRKTYI